MLFGSFHFFSIFILVIYGLLLKAIFEALSLDGMVKFVLINPRTTISFGTSGWVLMVSTVLRTEVGVFVSLQHH